MAANQRGASLEVTQQFLNQWSCPTECSWRSRSGLASARPWHRLRLPAGWVQGSFGSACVAASRDIKKNDTIYSPLSKNVCEGSPQPTQCQLPRPNTGAPLPMGDAAAISLSSSEELLRKWGTRQPASSFPSREPASVILEHASLLKHSPHLRQQPASSVFSPAFIWAGVGQPRGARSARRCQLAQPAASPAVPAAGVVGTHQKSLEKHENIDHTSHLQLRMRLKAKKKKKKATVCAHSKLVVLVLVSLTPYQHEGKQPRTGA